MALSLPDDLSRQSLATNALHRDTNHWRYAAVHELFADALRAAGAPEAKLKVDAFAGKDI
jgi:hypothetical protein